MATEVELNGRTYRVGKMDVRKQFHVARRLAPVFATLGEIATKKASDLLAVAGPLAEVLSRLSDEDCDYVIDACLQAATREHKGQFSPVMSRNGTLMFQDIEMPEMLQLAIAVIQDNMSSFFPAAA